MYAEQTSFLGSIAPPEARYKAIASIGADRVFHQEFHLPNAVPEALRKTCVQGDDTYLSLCDYIKPWRNGENVFGFNAFGFDIDCHDSQDPYMDAMATYRQLKESLFGGSAFPIPSMVEHTGRGLLVIVSFERAPRQVLPLWLRMGEGWARRIREALPGFAVLDGTYADAARVVRVPDSFNTRAGRYAHLLDYEENYPIYRLETLRNQYFPELIPKRSAQTPPHASTETAQSGRKPAAVFFTDPMIRLHMDRLQDLVCLCEMREHRMEGLREIVLFLYRYWTCFYIGPEAALQAALELNARFTRSLPEKEAIKATRSAEDAFRRWKEDRRGGYNYRNSTLIRLLRISPQEQQRMTTIISKEEKAARRAKKQQWGHEQRATLRKRQKQQRRQAILNAIHAGMTHREICREFRCSFRTIQNLASEQIPIEE